MLKVDAASVRAMQIEKLKRLRAERDEAATAGRARGADRRRARQGQSPATVRRGGARQGDGRRDLARDGEGVRPPCRADPRDLRRLSRRIGTGRGRQRARDRDDPRVRRERGPSAAHPGRQDGPGRTRPRPEDHRLGLRRSRLRRQDRPAVRDARGSRGAGGGEQGPYRRRLVARGGPSRAGRRR